MSKRKPGTFRRRQRDFYPTTYAQAEPLFEHLAPGTRFFEPCAGAGHLVRHLTANRFCCVGQSDIKPRDQTIAKRDALKLTLDDLNDANVIITNPPHARDMLVPLIEHFRTLVPAWLLLPIDRLVVDYMQEHLCYASMIVPSKRLKLPGTEHSGHDNYVWVQFRLTRHMTEFLPRETQS